MKKKSQASNNRTLVSKTNLLNPLKKNIMIDNVLIVYRDDTPLAEKLSTEVKGYLAGQEIKSDILSYSQLEGRVCPQGYNLVIVLGGDGTYLSTVRHIHPHTTPILGINMGSLGFLTEVKVDAAYEAIDQALSGTLERRPRSMLDVSVLRGQKTLFNDNVLNDIVIERGSRSQLVRIQIFSQDNLVQDLKADGLIIATPTGSTAYNLAAGGPILHPDLGGFVVSPVAPHNLTSRPIVFPEHLQLKLRLAPGNQTAQLTIDGRNALTITEHDQILIKKSMHVHFVLRRHGHNYFDLLREKLKFGQRD